jgi:hypothetical protein
MANIKAKITPQNKFLVTNYRINASTVSIGDLLDIDLAGQEDGAHFVYNSTTGKWEATRFIENTNTIINGGNF